MTGTTIALAAIILCTTPLTALAEQLMFRGGAMPAIAARVRSVRLGLELGIVGSSLLFASAHTSADPWTFSYHVFLGLWMAIMVPGPMHGNHGHTEPWPTRQDLLNARLDLEASREDLRDARTFGDRRDVIAAGEHEARARQRLKRKRQQYQDDNACGPLYLAQCPERSSVKGTVAAWPPSRNARHAVSHAPAITRW